MKTVATTSGVSRSNPRDRLNASAEPRRGCCKVRDAAVPARIRALAAKRPTCGYRRITALLNRAPRARGPAPVNRKRVYRIMARNRLLPERSGFERAERARDGKVIMMRSNPRRCPDGPEFACRNGGVIRMAFPIDAHDRESIPWRAVANIGIGGSDARDMPPEAAERRSAGHRAREHVAVLPDNGGARPAADTRILARQPGLKSCLTPVGSPRSSGMPEAFVRTPKRDYVRVNPLPDARTVSSLTGARIEDCNKNRPQAA